MPTLTNDLARLANSANVLVSAITVNSSAITSVNVGGGVLINTTTNLYGEKLTSNGAIAWRGHTDGINGILNAYSGYAWIGSVTAHPVNLISNNNPTIVLAPNNNVGVGTSSPRSRLHVANEILVGRVDASAEGGEIKLCRSTDDAAAYSIDVYGSGTNPEFRLFNSIAGTVFFSSANSGVNYIKFNPTQNAVGDANALDDYEEGTWTPTWRAATIGNTPTFTYTSQQGRYVKIGSQVTVWCKLSWSNKTGGTADLAFISGLPFAQYNAGGQDHPGGGSINYASGLPVLCGLYADASSNYMVCMKNNAGVSYLGITTDVGTSGQIMASYTYYTNS